MRDQLRVLPAHPVIALMVFAGAVSAHNHVTVDTPSGQPGDPAIIRAGYLPAESGYAVDAERRLLYNGSPAVYHLQEAASGPHAGWYTANADLLTLTSDFFYTSGRLGLGFSFVTFTYAQPADFRFEIVGVEPVCGAEGARYAHGLSSNMGESDGATREARSFTVAAGDHQHNQRMFISEPGVYDVRLRLWDASGIFTTAADGGEGDLVFRVSTGHAGPADLAAPIGTLNFFDLSELIAMYNAGDPGADFAAPFGQLNFFDIAAYLDLYLQGCVGGT